MSLSISEPNLQTIVLLICRFCLIKPCPRPELPVFLGATSRVFLGGTGAATLAWDSELTVAQSFVATAIQQFSLK